MASSEETITGSKMEVRSVIFSPAPAEDVAGGKDAARSKRPERTMREVDLGSLWSKARSAVDEAAQNRGREAHALKAMHEYLVQLRLSQLAEAAKLEAVTTAITQLARIKDWDHPQWFKTQPAAVKDGAGKMVSERELVVQRNHLSEEQMSKWDEWAAEAGQPFERAQGDADSQVLALDKYIVRRVALDSIKNWLRRRPAEPFVNDMFAALAQNKLYIDKEQVRVKALKDLQGNVRAVEVRDGKLFFEGTEEEAPVHEDANGRYVELPDDSDMIVFERRTINGQPQVVPVAQPNGRDPNIQWFSGAAVKRGWAKEERFFAGPDKVSMEELYGFFPDHFPMRLTNSTENRLPTLKVGGAIYGYAKEHAGRQARQLIAEVGQVMPALKRNNSQLINDARQLFGLQKTVSVPRPGSSVPSQAV